MFRTSDWDKEFTDRCCLGFDREHTPEGIDGSESYLSYILGEKDQIPKTPRWAEAITGVRAEVIRSLAVRYGSARPAALIQGYGWTRPEAEYPRILRWLS